jgi:hypothetical protein
MMRSIGGWVGVASVVLACGGNSASSAFVGTWSCMNTLSGTGAMNMSTSTYTITESGQTVTIVATGPDGKSCTAQLTANGTTATINPAQSCTLGGLTISYAGGTATVNGNSLSANLTFTAQVAGVKADGTQTTSCSRM